MQYVDVLLALAALGGLCCFFQKKCGIAAALTPLVAVGSVMLWFSASAVAGILYPAGFLFYLLSYGLGIYSLVTSRSGIAPESEKNRFFSPGMTFFIAASFLCFLYFAVRKPIFFEWDEMSFWGTAAKLMKLNDSIYTTAEIAWDWIPSQMPGLVSFSYFLQFFGEMFAPWKVLLAYNIVFFAMYAAMLAGFSYKHYVIAVPVSLLGLLTPYFLTVYGRLIYPSHVYLCSYGDIPAGMMSGACLCWYYHWKQQEMTEEKILPRGFWALLLILAAGSLFKDNTFVIQLVAAGIIALDLLCFTSVKNKIKTGKKWLLQGGIVTSLFFAAASSYIWWIRYIGGLAAQREAAGAMGNTSLPLPVVVMRGFEMLFSPEKRSERFNQVTQDMLQAFLETKVFSLGSGIILVGLILGIFILTAICSGSALHRKRTWLAMGLSTAGFVGYYWVLILSYTFIFKEMDAVNLASYNRYVQSYYLGWFLLAVIMLAIGAKNSRPFGFLKGALLALCCGVTLVVSWLVPSDMSVLDYSDSHFYGWKQVQYRAEEIRETIPNDGKIFYVNQHDNGLGFFQYCYELLPYQMDLSFGGGEIGIPENNHGGIYYHDSYLPQGAKPGEERPLDLEGLSNYLVERECKYIFIDNLDSGFCTYYSSLFTDNLDAAQAGTALIYQQCSKNPLQYEPVPRPEKEEAAA